MVRKNVIMYFKDVARGVGIQHTHTNILTQKSHFYFFEQEKRHDCCLCEPNRNVRGIFILDFFFSCCFFFFFFIYSGKMMIFLPKVNKFIAGLCIWVRACMFVYIIVSPRVVLFLHIFRSSFQFFLYILVEKLLFSLLFFFSYTVNFSNLGI